LRECAIAYDESIKLYKHINGSYSDLIFMGILDYIVNKNIEKHNLLIKSAVQLKINELVRMTSCNLNIDYQRDYEWALYAASIDEMEMATKISSLLDQLKIENKKCDNNGYMVMRKIVLDLIIRGKIDGSSIDHWKNLKSHKTLRDGHIKLAIGVGTNDIKLINESARYILKNIQKMMNPMGIFGHNLESFMDLWSIALIKISIKNGLKSNAGDDILNYYYNTICEFNPNDISANDVVKIDKKDLISSITLELKSDSYDLKLKSSKSGDKIEDVIARKYDKRGYNRVKNLSDVFDSFDVDKIFECVLRSHSFNSAGWCKKCLSSIESCILLEKICTNGI
jgi:hypothetical protein